MPHCGSLNHIPAFLHYRISIMILSPVQFPVLIVEYDV